MGCSPSTSRHLERKWTFRPVYPNGPNRAHVPHTKNWSTKAPDYSPCVYTAPSVLKCPSWADNEADLKTFKFNTIDGKIDRRSFSGPYQISPEGLPLNPAGRTGLAGRGLLGRFGPNHAADPIVTRWRRDPVTHEVLHHFGRPVLEFVGIRRLDTGDWAIPGGMVETGDTVSATLRKEFCEEALNMNEKSEEEARAMTQALQAFFSRGVEICKGYVDDPRNTDNAWMETVAYNFHDDDGTVLDCFPLQAGDDAGAVRWIAAMPDLQLYASHRLFIDRVRQLHHAA